MRSNLICSKGNIIAYRSPLCLLLFALLLTHCASHSPREQILDAFNLTLLQCFVLTRDTRNPPNKRLQELKDHGELTQFLREYYPGKGYDNLRNIIQTIESYKQTSNSPKHSLPTIMTLVREKRILLKNYSYTPDHCRSPTALEQHLTHLATFPQSQSSTPLVILLLFALTLFLTGLALKITPLQLHVTACLLSCLSALQRLTIYTNRYLNHLQIRLLILKKQLHNTHSQFIIVPKSIPKLPNSSTLPLNTPLTKPMNNEPTIHLDNSNPTPDSQQGNTSMPAVPTAQTTYSPLAISSNSNWLIIGASATGLSHQISNTPCQDRYHYKDLGQGWGIVVVADGAGSARYSELGAHFITQEVTRLFEIFTLHNLQTTQQLPKRSHWESIAKTILHKAARQLQRETLKWGVSSPKLFACTVIVLIYTPHGLLFTHIGDGRAAYRDQQGLWKAMMTPWRGEEANSTLFITSQDIWQDPSFIESHLILEPASAFALLTDGCEKSSFECSQFDTHTQKWHDPNKPFEKFFQPITQKLLEMQQLGLSEIEIAQRWQKFLEQGNDKLKQEEDDKTMVIGILLSENS